jgi:hypothetical protein
MPLTAPQRRKPALTLAILLATGIARAATPTLPQISQTQFQQELTQLQQLTQACANDPKSCTSKPVPTDQSITAAPPFTLQWDWLRSALDSAAKAKPNDRNILMAAAANHLTELTTETFTDPTQNFAAAHAVAQRILARSEFQSDTGPNWFDRQMAKFWALLAILFGGLGSLGKSFPILGITLEVLLYLGAAVGLIYLIRRIFVRQRLAISLGAGAKKASTWDKEAEDWAALADTCATQQQWRDAVHCLYWASIVRLESRRAWRHNPTRTPREYVRLLQPGSPQQTTLRTLTQIFERVWYGLRDATPDDYQQARTLFDGLSANTTEATA